MSDEKASELAYYEQQLAETEKLMLTDPTSVELEKIASHLRGTLESLKANESTGSDEAPSSLEGRTCEAFFNNTWFNAEIHSVRRDGDKEKVIVKLMGKDQAREYHLADIKLLPWASKKQFPSGTKVQAIWKDDGLWYNGIVDRIASDGAFLVSFDGFEGEAEAVRPDRIRVPITVAPKPREKITASEKTYTTPAGYVVPEKLKIDPTRDTEAKIAEKKRKIHLIKSQQRSEKHSEDMSANKSKWQQFQNTMSKRSL